MNPKPQSHLPRSLRAKPAKPVPPRGPEMKYVYHSAIGYITWPVRECVNGNMFHSTIGRAIESQPELSGHHFSTAGFFRIENGIVHCYGRSESLGIGGSIYDSERLAKQFNMKPYGE